MKTGHPKCAFLALFLLRLSTAILHRGETDRPEAQSDLATDKVDAVERFPAGREAVDFLSLPSTEDDRSAKAVYKNNKSHVYEDTSSRSTPIIFHLGTPKPPTKKVFQHTQNKSSKNYKNIPGESPQRTNESGKPILKTATGRNFYSRKYFHPVHSAREVGDRENMKKHASARPSDVPYTLIPLSKPTSEEEKRNKDVVAESVIFENAEDDLSKTVNATGDDSYVDHLRQESVSVPQVAGNFILKSERDKTISSNEENDLKNLSSVNITNYKVPLSYFVSNSSSTSISVSYPTVTTLTPIDYLPNKSFSNIFNISDSKKSSEFAKSNFSETIFKPTSELSQLPSTRIPASDPLNVTTPLPPVLPSTLPTISTTTPNNSYHTVPVSPVRVDHLLGTQPGSSPLNVKQNPYANPLLNQFSPGGLGIQQSHLGNGFGGLGINYGQIGSSALPLGPQSNPFLSSLGVDYQSLLGNIGKTGSSQSVDQPFSLSSFQPKQFTSIDFSSLFPSLQGLNFDPILSPPKTSLSQGYSAGQHSPNNFPGLSLSSLLSAQPPSSGSSFKAGDFSSIETVPIYRPKISTSKDTKTSDT